MIQGVYQFERNPIPYIRGRRAAHNLSSLFLFSPSATYREDIPKFIRLFFPLAQGPGTRVHTRGESTPRLCSISTWHSSGLPSSRRRRGGRSRRAASRRQSLEIARRRQKRGYKSPLRFLSMYPVFRASHARRKFDSKFTIFASDVCGGSRSHIYRAERYSSRMAALGFRTRSAL